MGGGGRSDIHAKNSSTGGTNGDRALWGREEGIDLVGGGHPRGGGGGVDDDGSGVEVGAHREREVTDKGWTLSFTLTTMAAAVTMAATVYFRGGGGVRRGGGAGCGWGTGGWGRG